MPILFRCQGCEKPLTIGTRKAGHAIHCPTCDQQQQVPHHSDPNLHKKLLAKKGRLPDSEEIQAAPPNLNSGASQAVLEPIPAILVEESPDRPKEQGIRDCSNSGELATIAEALDNFDLEGEIMDDFRLKEGDGNPEANNDQPKEGILASKPQIPEPVVCESPVQAQTGLSGVSRKRFLPPIWSVAGALALGLLLCFLVPDSRPKQEHITQVVPTPESKPETIQEPTSLPPASGWEAQRKTEINALGADQSASRISQTAGAQKNPTPIDTNLVSKPMNGFTEVALRADLKEIHEISLNIQNKNDVLKLFKLADKRDPGHEGLLGPILPDDKKEVLRGLPLLLIGACRRDKIEAQALETASTPIRQTLGRAFAEGTRLFQKNPAKADEAAAVLFRTAVGSLKTTLKRQVKHHDSVVPAVTQMLQADAVGIRKCMVDWLGEIDSKESTQAIASRACTDLDEKVRKQAVDILRKRNQRDYLPVLLKYVEYPWAPVATNASNALVELKVMSAVPALIKMLEKPEPLEPRQIVLDGHRQYAVPQVVKVNHLANCLLCHPPSFKKTDLVRGFVPTPDRPIPPSYYRNQRSTDQFVRADTTYIRQDFSLMQTVENAGPWPERQRFDYFVRMKPVSEDMAQYLKTNLKRNMSPQRRALLSALQSLTGRNFGNHPEDWQNWLAGQLKIQAVGEGN